MPKFTKCWYKDCDSDNRVNPHILFYKFPKDIHRCRLWVKNCNNLELDDIWQHNPSKIGTYRICQKHFLKEFLGSSSRLVGHAIPAPYGLALTDINGEKFMSECANLKTSNSTLLDRPNYCSAQSPYQSQVLTDPNELRISNVFNNNTQYNQDHEDQQLPQNQPQQQLPQHQQQQQQQQQLQEPYGQTYNDYLFQEYQQNDEQESHVQIALTDFQNPNHPSSIPIESDTDNPTIYQQQALVMNTNNGIANVNNYTDMTTLDANQQQQETCSQEQFGQRQIIETNANYQLPTINDNFNCDIQQQQRPQLISNNYQPSDQQQQDLASTSSLADTNTTIVDSALFLQKDSELIVNDYRSTEFLPNANTISNSDLKRQEALITDLKSKVRHYQRKLAVTTHRYTKLKNSSRGRTKMMKLLEALKECKPDFDPFIYELFKRQIRCSASKHGNRWSDDVKIFSSSIYLRSKSTYKFIRRKIDLPSESIVRRFIDEKKLKSTETYLSSNHDQTDDQINGSNANCEESIASDESNNYFDGQRIEHLSGDIHEIVIQASENCFGCSAIQNNVR